MIQEYDYDCAPVAIINAYEYFLGNKSYIHEPIYNCLTKICGTDEDGTTDAGIHRGLRWLLHNSEIRVIRKRKIDYDEIIEFLSTPDQCILLNHIDYGNEPHVSMFHGVYANWVQGKNIFAGKHKANITKRTFKKYVESSDGVWFIRRRYVQEMWSNWYENISRSNVEY